MAAEPFCEVMEMPVASCAHCRPPVPQEQPVHPQQGFRTLTGGFPATFASRCSQCREYIEIGDLIRKHPDTDLYVHEDCA